MEAGDQHPKPERLTQNLNSHSCLSWSLLKIFTPLEFKATEEYSHEQGDWFESKWVRTDWENMCLVRRFSFQIEE